MIMVFWIRLFIVVIHILKLLSRTLMRYYICRAISLYFTKRNLRFFYFEPIGHYFVSFVYQNGLAVRSKDFPSQTINLTVNMAGMVPF